MKIEPKKMDDAERTRLQEHVEDVEPEAMRRGNLLAAICRSDGRANVATLLSHIAALELEAYVETDTLKTAMARMIDPAKLQVAVDEISTLMWGEEQGAAMLEGREAIDRAGRATGFARALDVLKAHTGIEPRE